MDAGETMKIVGSKIARALLAGLLFVAHALPAYATTPLPTDIWTSPHWLATTAGSVCRDGARNCRESIAFASDGTVTVTAGGGTAAYTTRFAADGSRIWQTEERSFPSGRATSTRSLVALDDGVALIGAAQATTPGQPRLLVRKRDLAGALVWETELDPVTGNTDFRSGQEQYMVLALLPGGDLAVGLSVGPSAGTAAVYRIDSASGTVAWRREIAAQSASGLYVRSLAAVNGGGLMIGGNDGESMLAARMDAATGEVAWLVRSRRAADSFDRPVDLLALAGGDVVLAGDTRTSVAGSSDFYSVRLRANDGVELWRRSFTSAASVDDFARAATLGNDGSILIAGNSAGDVTTVRLDAATGAVSWSRTSGQVSGGADSVADIQAVGLDVLVLALAQTSTCTNSLGFRILRYAGASGAIQPQATRLPPTGGLLLPFAFALSPTEDQVFVGSDTGATSGCGGQSFGSNEPLYDRIRLSDRAILHSVVPGPARGSAFATGAPGVGADGLLDPILHVSSNNGAGLVRIDRTSGAEIWRRPLDVRSRSSIELSSADSLVLSSEFGTSGGGAPPQRWRLTRHDRSTGLPVWAQSYPAASFGNFGSEPRSAVPMPDGGAIVVGILGGTRVVRFPSAGGTPLWERSLSTRNFAGIGQSPSGSVLLMTSSGADVFLGRIDIATGSNIWESLVPLPSGFTSCGLSPIGFLQGDWLLRQSCSAGSEQSIRILRAAHDTGVILSLDWLGAVAAGNVRPVSNGLLTRTVVGNLVRMQLFDGDSGALLWTQDGLPLAIAYVDLAVVNTGQVAFSFTETATDGVSTCGWMVRDLTSGRLLWQRALSPRPFRSVTCGASPLPVSASRWYQPVNLFQEGSPNTYALVAVDVPESSSTSITSATPDPSAAGALVTVTGNVSGDANQPTGGAVTVVASTGETCTDTTLAASIGTAAEFGCAISFLTVGPRTLTASFSGSATHSDSTSAAEPHSVVTTLNVAPTNLPDGMFGAAYSSTVTASGAGSTAPYSYVVSDGTMPPGLSLSQTSGEVVGTPTATGTYVFEITASDSSSPALGGPFTGKRGYTVHIARANQAPLTPIALPASLAFGATSVLSTTGGSGTGAVSFAVTAGASFCSVSGTTLTGTGVGTCTITATKAADANYNAATATVDVTVNRANQVPLTLTATPALVPLTRTAALSVAGGSGTGAVSYAVTAGDTFCSISGATLTGTGVGTCTVTATKSADAEYNAATAQIDVVIQAATDLEVSKNDGTPWAIPDSTILYEILVANAGPLVVQGARLRDLLPEGLVDGLWTCESVQSATCPQAAGTGDIDQVLELPVNGILRYELSARVTAPLGSMLTNTATVEVPATVVELEPADNSASDTDSVVSQGLFFDGFEPAPQAISVPSKGR